MKQRLDQRGFALPMVMWAVALVGLLVTLMTVTIRTARVEDIGYEKYHEAERLARSGLATGAALAQQRLRDDFEPWLGRFPHEDSWAFVPCLGGEVWLAITEESGKIDINKASEALLLSLLQNHIAGDRPADEITAKILDWRDADDIPREGGAETSSYQAEGLRTRPANGPFISVQELRSVIGVSEEAFASIERYVTVHGAPTINPLAASEAVLQSIPELNEGDVQRILTAQVLQDPAGEITNVLARASSSLSRARSPVISVRAAVRTATGSKAAREVLIQWASPEPGPTDPPPLVILEERRTPFPNADELPPIGEANCL